MNPGAAVRVTEPPSQKVTGPLALIDGVATVTFTFTFFGALGLLRQPNELPTCTVYDPAVPTVMDWVVAPVDHK